MRLRLFQKTTASILSGLLILAVPGVGAAESLAGSKGDGRFAVNFPPGSTGDCPKAYKAYVAASGHSAYATTFYSRVVDLYVICGSRLNAPSQKAAEEMALRNCQAGLTRWKVRTASGGCAIAASK
ncbi:MAG: hypothetical protein EOS50_22900 [Mesorhizobium sp.]|nr:hypothetical protein [Mesorhizobium sp.]RWD38820.1 MAG: hypothetical protein EOS34_03605 [Mesorhizobium sp.]RWD83939.1 MAG: hypothetical protein EOS48_08610 [Mesorhizobium sp.]RWE57456.1 MAG: hypothetical protein EOS67_15540 [Mesorhizobium sp.]RWF53000.1 MAG: hypothetical protein EOS50_22900 [Mesorhizobium sp.]TIS38822.1 MAG: hypothetical protein E5W95_16400 [Mesorhizobium sp.]